MKSIKFNQIVFHLFIIIIFLVDYCSARASIRQLEKKILDEILGNHYDNRIRPSGANATSTLNDGACHVRVNIFVRSISRIDDVTMEYATQITFREEWTDDRLKYNKNSGIRFLTLTEPEKIWKPDLFFSNEKEGHFHNIIMPNVLLRIYPDGKVLYSIRISLVLFCPMHLKYFPLDQQTCKIQMASYGYTTEDLVFLWKETTPVQVVHPLSLPRFKLIKSKTDYCTSKTNTGEYSCIYVDLIFKREFSYYLILIYVPCCMLVIVSWVSFWIDPNSTAARVLLGVTSLLTMSRQNSGINASLPPVSYTKAVDVWTGCCLTFVFGALIEFAVVNYVSRQDNQEKKKKRLNALTASVQASMAAAGDREFGQRTGIGGAQSSYSSTRPHRRRNANRSSRKKFESGKDSGIESDDLEEVIATRYVKSLGATKLTGAHKNSLPLSFNQQENVPLTSGGHRDSAGNFSLNDNLPPPVQYASDSPSSNGKKQMLMQNQLNNRTGSTSSQPVYRGGQQQSSIDNGNDKTNFVNLVVNSEAKTNAVRSKRSRNFFVNWLNRFPTRSKRIDVLSRIFFPLLFALFNVFYWVTYLFRDYGKKG